MGRIEMKLLLQIGVLAGVCYQAFAALPQIPDRCGSSGWCDKINGICSLESPGEDYVKKFLCRSPNCYCWVRESRSSCNGLCKDKWDKCSKTSPGLGWTNTGQVCDPKSGCTCWTSIITPRCNGKCKNKGDRCSKFTPGFGWSNTGQVCDRRSGCTCWTRTITPRCNGRCRNKGERCSKFPPGKGWSNTGNVCDKTNGCTCWSKKECHDDKCKAMGGICKDQRPPGRGWWKVGQCKGRCFCWTRFIIHTKPTPGDLD